MKISRRLWFVFLLTLPSALLLASLSAPAKNSKGAEYLAFVGTYTSKTASKGIYSFRFDSNSGKLTALGVAADSADPSFLVPADNHKYLYAVNELSTFQGKPTGALTAYQIDRQAGKLTQINQVPSGGAGPCFISLDRTGKFALAANYDGGSVATFPIAADGSLQPASSFVQHTGSGPNKERQEAPHAHWIATTPDNQFALAVDLGLDQVLIYRFNSSTGALSPNNPPYATLPPGSGPRHLALHPNAKFAYVLNEIKSTLTTFSFDAKAATFSQQQTLSTLPANFSSANDTAEIVVHPSGKFLYASNRGHDSIVLFAINPETGTLTPAGDFPTQGKTPRNFALDPSGKFLLAANEESNNIVIFRIDPKTGALSATGQTVEVPAPVDVIFVPSN